MGKRRHALWYSIKQIEQRNTHFIVNVTCVSCRTKIQHSHQSFSSDFILFDTATGRHDFDTPANVSCYCFPISNMVGIATIPDHLIIQSFDEANKNTGIGHLTQAPYHAAVSRFQQRKLQLPRFLLVKRRCSM